MFEVDAVCKTQLRCSKYNTSEQYSNSYCCIAEVPSDISPFSQRVYLSGNIITRIPAGIFSHLSKCRNLFMERNDISSLQEESFTGMVSLLYLQLERNKISSIETGTFGKLKTLQYLYLDFNYLSTIHVGMFAGLFTKLNGCILGVTSFLALMQEPLIPFTPSVKFHWTITA